MKKILNKILIINLSIIMVLMPAVPALALENVTPPPAVTPPPMITPPPSIEEPSQPSEPSEPTPPEPAFVTPPPMITPPPSIVNPALQTQQATQDPINSTQVAQQPAGNTSSSGNVGDTNLSTGDASNESSIDTSGNNNSAGLACCGGGSASVINSGNGAQTNNNGSASTVNNNNLNQENGASIANDLNSATTTGDNATSFNVGDSNLSTGNANTTGSITTNINSNLAGVAVSEFNIADDHVGDYVLDFGANCISGCGGSGSTTVANVDNGAYSNNDAATETVNNNDVDQANDAGLVNNMNLAANSGDNSASFNTNGDSSIQTGDANVAANIFNFVNNNVSGNVLFGVVNIFGNLIGDIILPEDPCSVGCNGSGTNVANTGNSAGSTNTASSDTTTTNNTNQANNATIENNLIFDANSGDNSTSFNTGGDSTVMTGDTSVNANVVNIANTNMSGGNWWLVIVNQAGQWIGQIVGAPGSNMGGSEGTQFVVDEHGQVTVVNSENGAGSNNNASASTTTTNNINQSNDAHVVNNVNLSANTGGNKSSFNTGGDSNIVTGDATIVANIINFVNNNIVGDGKLVVTFVNVFGSWLGDFVGPGQEKAPKNQTQTLANGSTSGVGGVQESNDPSTSDNHGNEDNKNETGPGNFIASAQEKVAGIFGTISGSANAGSSISFGGNTNVSGQGEGAQIQKVAGVQSATPADESGKVTLNLAWLVVILPSIGLLYIVKKYVIKSILLSRVRI